MCWLCLAQSPKSLWPLLPSHLLWLWPPYPSPYRKPPANLQDHLSISRLLTYSQLQSPLCCKGTPLQILGNSTGAFWLGGHSSAYHRGNVKVRCVLCQGHLYQYIVCSVMCTACILFCHYSEWHQIRARTHLYESLLILSICPKTPLSVPATFPSQMTCLNYFCLCFHPLPTLRGPQVLLVNSIHG